MRTELFAAPERCSDVSTVNIKLAEGVAVVAIASPSLREPDARQVETRLIAIARPDGPGLVRQAVSLGAVRDVTSAAIAAFLRVSDRLDHLGGKLVLFEVPMSLRNAIRSAGLSRQLCVVDAEAEAVAEAFGRRRGWFRRRAA